MENKGFVLLLASIDFVPFHMNCDLTTQSEVEIMNESAALVERTTETLIHYLSLRRLAW